MLNSATSMPKVLLLTALLLLLPLGSGVRSTAENRSALSLPRPELAAGEQLFEEMNLGGKVNFIAFRQAVAGYLRIAEKRRNVLTLIDFSKPSTEKRLFVFDMERKLLLHSSVVAHGRNSGGNYATSFSNKAGSYKSSLGFYLTGNTYQGKNGYSMLLDGLEKGINDKARERAVVMHGAAYANPDVAASTGRLGRSFGCPALPQAVNSTIINAIKGGSVLFIYANNSDYLAQSTVLQGMFGNDDLRAGL